MKVIIEQNTSHQITGPSFSFVIKSQLLSHSSSDHNSKSQLLLSRSSSNHNFPLVRHQITTPNHNFFFVRHQITTSLSFVIKSQFSSRSSSNHNFSLSLFRDQITTSFSFVIRSQLLSRLSSDHNFFLVRHHTTRNPKTDSQFTAHTTERSNGIGRGGGGCS